MYFRSYKALSMYNKKIEKWNVIEITFKKYFFN